MTDADAVCARHGLRLREVFDSHYGLVARVWDGDGRDLLIKAPQPQQHDCMDEAEVLRAWRGRSCVPQLVAVLDDGHHLREFVGGTELSERPGAGRAHARGCGALLAELHRDVGANARAAAPRTWLETEARALRDSAFLADSARARATHCVAIIAAAAPTVVVHGDFYPRNILDTERGLVALDPLARLDVAAADLASFAMTCPGEPGATIADLVGGYGERPPALDAYVEMWGIRNRHYRGAFEAAAARDASLIWQPCFVDDGDGAIWVA